MAVSFVNLTPHGIHVMDGDGNQLLAVDPSGTLARVDVTRKRKGTIDNVPIYSTTYGQVTGLPAPRDGVFYIVSGMVRDAVPDRDDLVSPGLLVRDDDGRPIGCKGFDG